MQSRSVKPFRIGGQLRGIGQGQLGLAVEAALEKVLALEHLNDLYSQIPPAANIDEFLDRVLQTLRVQYQVVNSDAGLIPARGRLVVVANHPFGALEGIILAHLIRRVRPDVRFVANFLLSRIPELRQLFFAVDPFGGADAPRRNLAGLRQARAWLEQEGCLVIFPAGEVSHLHIIDRTITDPPWHTAAARLAHSSGAPVLPVYFHGTNSALFHLAGLLQPRLRTAMLPRELLNKHKAALSLVIGHPIGAEKLAQAAEPSAMTDYLRFRTYLLSTAIPSDTPLLRPVAPAARRPEPAPLAPAQDPGSLAAEIAALERRDMASRLVQENELCVYLAQASEIPNVMLEIGRLREVTFRAAGEGTGRCRDIDLFDAYYDHLVLWNAASREVVGAYRLARTDVVRRRYAIRGLYTATLFRYDATFLDALGTAVELGRSFVRPEYQRSYAGLMLLWKGIGQYLARFPQYTTLFGPVSVSNAYHPLSRALMVEFLKTHHHEPALADLVRPRRPFRSPLRFRGGSQQRLPVGLDLAELDELVGHLESDGKGLPVLLRHYLKLGGRFAGFSVDSDFGHCIDGLIAVDMRQVPLNVLRRYMGKEAATNYLANHAEDGEQSLSA